MKNIYITDLDHTFLKTDLSISDYTKTIWNSKSIDSIEAIKRSKFAALYSATKAGLKAFSDSLFEETRKSGLSVTNINPDMTQTSFYDELRFDTSDKEEEKLLASDIADAIEHILKMRKGAVVSDYTIRSLKFGISKKTKH
jgi:short-subunit dehydrogenase